jgi:hypothetical protein
MKVADDRTSAIWRPFTAVISGPAGVGRQRQHSVGLLWLLGQWRRVAGHAFRGAPDWARPRYSRMTAARLSTSFLRILKLSRESQSELWAGSALSLNRRIDQFD